MSPQRRTLAVLVLVLPSLGASYRTPNFVVEAPTPQAAKQAAESAEKYREAIARQWLGHRLPDWDEPCVLNVNASSAERRGGSSTFYFDRGRVVGQTVNVRGPMHELLPKVLPHELTHSIFAHYFGCPVPRWADEGSAILAEDVAERERRDLQMERILGATNLTYPLEVLFDLNDYPGDLRVFYTQSYSVTRFLVELQGRERYLSFVRAGMRDNWDRAVRTYYDFAGVADLERAWRARLRLSQRRREAVASLAGQLSSIQTLGRRAWEASREQLARLESGVLVLFLSSSDVTEQTTARATGENDRGALATAPSVPAATLSTK